MINLKIKKSKKGIFFPIFVLLGFVAGIAIIMTARIPEGDPNNWIIGRNAFTLIHMSNFEQTNNFYIQNKAELIYRNLGDSDSHTTLINKFKTPNLEEPRDNCKLQNYIMSYSDYGIQDYRQTPFWKILNDKCFPKKDYIIDSSLKTFYNEIENFEEYKDYEIILSGNKIYGVSLNQKNLTKKFNELVETSKRVTSNFNPIPQINLTYYSRPSFSFEIEHDLISIFNNFESMTGILIKNITDCLKRGGTEYSDNDMDECKEDINGINQTEGLYGYNISIKEHNFDNQKRYFVIVFNANATNIENGNEFVLDFGVLLEDNIPPPKIEQLSIDATRSNLEDGLFFEWEENMASDLKGYYISCRFGSEGMIMNPEIYTGNKVDEYDCGFSDIKDSDIYDYFKGTYSGYEEIEVQVSVRPIDFNNNSGEVTFSEIILVENPFKDES